MNMKFLEKFTEGAGIALYYAGGTALIWFGAICTLLALALWGIVGGSVPLAIFFGLFGCLPVGGGIWLFRRGKILKQVFTVKLQKETVRKLAFEHQGRLRPIDLAHAQEWTEERALDVLKNLVAEDPERIELQLDYESGDIYFEFSDIRRIIEEHQHYQPLPISKTLGRKAAEIAMVVEDAVDTFHEYMQYTEKTVSDHHKQQQEERYRAKITRFLHEIDELKNQ
jgi:hypothetical protein